MNAIALHEIQQTLKLYNIKNYVISSDGSVNVNGNVDLAGSVFEYLPVKFGTVSGIFNISNCRELLTLEGSPHVVTKSFVCAWNIKLKSLAGAPHAIGEYLNISGCDNIDSLLGFESRCKSVVLSHQNIKHGGIGLIGKTQDLLVFGLASGGPDPFKIIEKYLGRPNDIFECQAELIEAGYTEYAQL